MIIIKCGNHDYNTTNINFEATINCNDDANITEVFYAIVKATLFEGYSIDSWTRLIKEMNDSNDGIDDNYSVLDFLTDSIYN
jgi:hypothetical protein